MEEIPETEAAALPEAGGRRNDRFQLAGRPENKRAVHLVEFAG